ncbi:MAG TPA: hypothetical protein ENH50_04510 [Nitrospirae bacterium]|nr:hypothetical protein [Nitrospirota bacterium]
MFNRFFRQAPHPIWPALKNLINKNIVVVPGIARAVAVGYPMIRFNGGIIGKASSLNTLLSKQENALTVISHSRK